MRSCDVMEQLNGLKIDVLTDHERAIGSPTGRVFSMFA